MLEHLLNHEFAFVTLFSGRKLLSKSRPNFRFTCCSQLNFMALNFSFPWSWPYVARSFQYQFLTTTASISSSIRNENESSRCVSAFCLHCCSFFCHSESTEMAVSDVVTFIIAGILALLAMLMVAIGALHVWLRTTVGKFNSNVSFCGSKIIHND